MPPSSSWKAGVLAGLVSILALWIGASAWAASPPTAYTGSATGITSSTAVVAGVTYASNQPTEYSFEYGPTAAYGERTPQTLAGAGKQSWHVTAALAGLSPATVYHYRMTANNASGTVYGNDRTFVTKNVPLRISLFAAPRVRYGSRVLVTGSLTGTGSAGRGLELLASPFPFRSGFKKVAERAAAANGEFSFLLPTLIGDTRIRVATVGRPYAGSATLSIAVSVAVSIHVRSVKRRGFARIFGTVAPAVPGASVHFQRLLGDGPATLLARRPLHGASRFGRTLRVHHGSRYRVLVRVPAGSGLRSAASRVVVIR